MKILFRLLVVACSIALIACSPSLEDAKKLGFKSVQELQSAKNEGFKNAEEYAMSKGFINLKEMRQAEPLKDVDQYARSLVFVSPAEMRDLQAKGFGDFKAYAKSNGFDDPGAFREEAAKRAADPYFDFPNDEKLFIKILSEAQSQSKLAANDMAREGISNATYNRLYIYFCDRKISDWQGKIKSISATDGFGIVKIEVAPKIFLKTKQDVYSDSQYGSLISPKSDLFKEASSMQKGQSVRFSGNFIAGSRQALPRCMFELSVSTEGRLDEPEFLFKFDSIKTQ